ncbi:MAG: hypothetical protein JO306_14210 [Gemmatimonadetes bacterium]|nr:hypothetical protein [Gemmatimonadota bacterium]
MDREAETDEEREAREEAAFLDRLRAAGVKLAERPLQFPAERIMQRPKWFAFLVRTFRLDRD